MIICLSDNYRHGSVTSHGRIVPRDIKILYTIELFGFTMYNYYDMYPIVLRDTESLNPITVDVADVEVSVFKKLQAQYESLFLRPIQIKIKINGMRYKKPVYIFIGNKTQTRNLKEIFSGDWIEHQNLLLGKYKDEKIFSKN